MYDMSERQFKQIAKDAGAIYKINRMVLVSIELLDLIWNVFVCSLGKDFVMQKV